MKISIIGTGYMGKGLLKTFYKSYPNDVSLSGRDIQHTQKVIDELQLNLRAISMEEALEADIIIPTLWFRDLLPWAKDNEEWLKGKIVIDITNPFNDDYDDFTIPYGESSAEALQKIIPNSIVVGAFKNTFWVVFDNPILQGLMSDIYVTCNDEKTLELIIKILRPLPFRVLNAGLLKNNRTIERMTLLGREMAIKAGSHPRIAFNLWGLEH